MLSMSSRVETPESTKIVSSPAWETGQYIGAQVIADDHRLLGVSLHFIQR